MADRIRVLSERTDLESSDRKHLRDLISDWVVLSDLAFSDLILWVPTWDRSGFTAVAQVRPSTGPSAIPKNMINNFVPIGRRLILDRALHSSQVVFPDSDSAGELEPNADIKISAIPVRLNGKTIAVVEARSAPRLASGGALEVVYYETAQDIIQMIVSGDFPTPETLAALDSPPRVGDGLIRLDTQGTVRWASPNAVSAFYRLGLSNDLVGARLTKVVARSIRSSGLADESIQIIASGIGFGRATIANLKGAMDLTSLPLVLAERRIGAVLFVRDVTDLREREQALLTKDATIREIHHRVKNNLQTVSALLRLQARRITDTAGKEALDEAVRRVGAIAVVHETLANQSSGDTSFDEVAHRIVAMTADLSQETTIRRSGSAGDLPSEQATALAMVIAEVLANAVRHGVEPMARELVAADNRSEIELTFVRMDDQLKVVVRDNGVGLPQEFSFQQSQGLGLQIIRTLVEDELKGSVTWSANGSAGTTVEIEIPVTT